MTLYLFLIKVTKELGEKIQVEEINVFCFHFLNAPAISTADDPQMSNVGKRSDGR